MTALEQLAHVGIFDVSKAVPTLDATERQITHYVGDRCAPDGHRGDSAPTQAADSPDYIDAAYRDDAR